MSYESEFEDDIIIRHEEDLWLIKQKKVRRIQRNEN